MAQDFHIYEAVCEKEGHDLFVLGRYDSNGNDRALCKKCGTEIVIGQSPNECGHGLGKETGVLWTLEHGGYVELTECGVCGRKGWEVKGQDTVTVVSGGAGSQAA